jgi:heterogeneous nuclear ribonucleoprotein F/H
MGDEEVKYVKARGLPWSASADEVLEFFNNCQVVGGSAGVHFINNYDGRPSGTCYLELSSAEDVTKALARDKDKMGKRYIEVFEASAAELEADLNRRPGGGDDGRGGDVGEDAVVKLRGLPFSASKVDIADFFAGLEIESNGILVVTDYEGRPKGEAYVQFTTTAGAERALEKNKQNMGHRYIEVFTSSMEEAKRAQVQMAFGAMGGGGGRGGGAGGPMRGGMMGPGAMMRPGPYDRMGGYGMGGGPPRGGGGYLGGGMRGGYFSGGGVMGMRGGGLGGMGMHGGMYRMSSSYKYHVGVMFNLLKILNLVKLCPGECGEL